MSRERRLGALGKTRVRTSQLRRRLSQPSSCKCWRKDVIASGSADASQALQRMVAHGVRRIPVVDDEQCVLGIVTLTGVRDDAATRD